MLLRFVGAVMPQLPGVKLLLERCWMKRHTEWVRCLTQLAKCPGLGQPRYVRALGDAVESTVAGA